MRSTGRAAAAAAACAVAALLLTSTPPSASVRLLTTPTDGEPTAALVGGIALMTWTLGCWLLLAAAVTAGGHLPGRAGRGAARLARRIAPRTVRRTVEVVLGLTVTGAVLGASPAAAATPPATDPAPVAVVSLDWGSAPPAALDWGSAPAVAEPTRVVVARGDSLWSLAERHLTERSTTEPSDAAIAAAWPAWWAANREVVGDDPHLLHPGTALVRPSDPT